MRETRSIRKGQSDNVAIPLSQRVEKNYKKNKKRVSSRIDPGKACNKLVAKWMIIPTGVFYRL